MWGGLFSRQPPSGRLLVKRPQACCMFMRFVTTRLHPESHQPRGVFSAAYALMDSEILSNEDRRHLRELLVWFNKNLPHPPKTFDARRATFWFKSSAKENVAKIWELVHFLRLHDHHVEVQKCSRLANIVFNDKYQVAAYPSERDGKVTTQ
jgi:hypothetical protein